MNDTQKDEKWYSKFWFTRNLVWTVIAVVSCYYDIYNFLQFKKEIKAVANDPRSMFNKLGLKVNWLGNIVYTQKIMDEDRVRYFNDRQKNNYLIEVTQTEHDYLFVEMNWAEYLVTNFIEFSDENDNQSGYYGVTFKFTPLSLTNSRVYKFLLFYLVFFGTVLWMCRGWIMTALQYLWSLM